MNLLLRNHQSIGDVIMLTACVRDLKKWYPSFKVRIATSTDVVFENNPHLCKEFPLGEDIVDIKMEYPLIHEIGDKDVHFLHGFINFINNKLSLRIKLTEFKGELYLTEQEKNWRPIKEKYWVMLAGGKSDFIAKIIWPEWWQEVVDKTNVKFVTLGGKEHQQYHPHLKNVIDMVGKTSIRQSFSLIYNCEGVISPVTFAMHSAAIFDKPCIVTAGGREHWWWEKYPGHHFLHTIGALPCCSDHGCWKNECDNKNEKGHQKCIELIKPEMVAEIINDMPHE